MGHYYSEMRTPETHERIEQLLKDFSKGDFILAPADKDKGAIPLSRQELRGLCQELQNLRNDLTKIKSLFRRLSR